MWIIQKLIYATTKAKKREQLIDEANKKIEKSKTYEEDADILMLHSYNLQYYARDLEFSLMCTTIALLIAYVSLAMEFLL